VSEKRIPQHQHPVHLTDPLSVYAEYNGGWKCDICLNEFNQNDPEPERGRPYHCFECTFDACHSCLQDFLRGQAKPTS